MSDSVDWAFWHALPTVKAWQAIALSLNINPDRMKHSPHGCMGAPEPDPLFGTGTSASPEIREEFSKRLRLLKAALADGGQFNAVTVDPSGMAYHGVQLGDVTAWLRRLGRTPVAEGLLVAWPAPAGAPVPADDTHPTKKIQATGEPSGAPVHQASVWQEEQIVRSAKSLGYNPLALPPDDRKTQFYVKSVIRKRCAENHPTKMRKTVFDKAWERMLGSNPPALRYAASSDSPPNPGSPKL